MTWVDSKTSSSKPLVSIIVPCYNEQDTIRFLLSALYDQSFDRSELEVLIADGRSTDHTRQEINQFQQAHPDLYINVLDNEKKSIPSGLNKAINAARGKYIVRLDAHSVPHKEYIARCVAALDLSLGDNVGGVWEIKPSGQDWIARAIATAASHPLAVGDARYRLGGAPQAVDTVPFGAYRKSLVDQLGGYDENLLTNEDYELNVRIRLSGGKIWMDPQIRTIYFARSTLGMLARQYWRYGYWKGRMIRRYPGTLRWRQLLPPLFILSLLIFGLMEIISPIFTWILISEISIYLVALIIAGLQMAFQKRDISLFLGLPLAIVVMHFSWGCAFLWNLVSKPQ